MEVYHPNDTFHFDQIHLSSPNSITGGSYLTKYTYYKKPLYIQTPKTISKQGIVVSGKKAYIDLLITGTNEHDTEFIQWITDLEKHSVDLLYEKRNLWFTQELDKVDIENSFTSPIRAFKTGSYLLRVNLELNRLQTHIQPFLCKVFDENRTIVPVDYVKADHNIISIIEFHGIKFTARSFQMELILRQVLVIPELPLFETCVITTNTNTNTTNDSSFNEEEPLGKRLETQPLDENSTKEFVEKIDESFKSYVPPTPPPITVPSSTSSTIKHFECTEVDIDFNNIPDVIDTKEPTFDVPPDSTSSLSSSSETQSGSILASIPLSTPKKTISSSGGSVGTITLKKHKDVVYEMYKVAKRKAQEAKKAAIRAYLEAKEIKASYMLDNLDDFGSTTSESESDDE